MKWNIFVIAELKNFIVHFRSQYVLGSKNIDAIIKSSQFSTPQFACLK